MISDKMRILSDEMHKIKTEEKERKKMIPYAGGIYNF